MSTARLAGAVSADRHRGDRRANRPLWPGTKDVYIYPPPRNPPPAPWLLTGRPAVSSGGAKARTLADPPHLHYQAAAAPSATPAAWPRSRRLHDNHVRRLPPPTARTGPCEERCLPLSRHTPKHCGKKSAPALQPGTTARPWLPTQEWRPARTSVATADCDRSWTSTPLASLLSPRVVERCDAQREAPEREAEASAWTVSERGGWAAELPISSAPPPSPPPGPPAQAWALEPETTHWRQRVAARERPRSMVALVDDFLAGGIAAAFLPPEPVLSVAFDIPRAAESLAQ